MSTAPKLPQHISPDGREVWDLADRLSQHTQLLHRRRELESAIRTGPRECGSCTKWMTRDCPREAHDNRKGHSVGPSAKSPTCGEYEMKDYDAKRLDGLRAELASVVERLEKQA